MHCTQIICSAWFERAQTGCVPPMCQSLDWSLRRKKWSSLCFKVLPVSWARQASNYRLEWDLMLSPAFQWWWRHTPFFSTVVPKCPALGGSPVPSLIQLWRWPEGGLSADLLHLLCCWLSSWLDYLCPPWRGCHMDVRECQNFDFILILI